MNVFHRSLAVGGASRILPRLWMGPHPPESLAPAQAGFSHLFLCAWERQGTFPGVSVRRVALDDADRMPTTSEVMRAFVAAHEIGALLPRGARILVTCSEGRNRSGLVVGLALIEMGFAPDQSIEWLRARRRADLPPDRPALTNPHFVAFLRAQQRAVYPRFALG